MSMLMGCVSLHGMWIFMWQAVTILGVSGWLCLYVSLLAIAICQSLCLYVWESNVWSLYMGVSWWLRSCVCLAPFYVFVHLIEKREGVRRLWSRIFSPPIRIGQGHHCAASGLHNRSPVTYWVGSTCHLHPGISLDSGLSPRRERRKEGMRESEGGKRGGPLGPFQRPKNTPTLFIYLPYPNSNPDLPSLQRLTLCWPHPQQSHPNAIHPYLPPVLMALSITICTCSAPGEPIFYLFSPSSFFPLCQQIEPSWSVCLGKSEPQVFLLLLDPCH